jgi:hypothetical protein
MIDAGKITFLILIFLFVIMVSNYMSVEGFHSSSDRKADAAKKTADAAKKAADAAKKAADAAKKVADDINKKLAGATPTSTGAAPTMSAENKAEIAKIMGDINLIKTGITNTAAVIARTASSINTKASSVKTSETNTKTMVDTINSKLSNMTNSSNNVESAANAAISKITEYATTIEGSVASNQQIKKDIDAKIVTINNQVNEVKSQADKAGEIKNQIEKVLENFKKSSDQILANINLAATDLEAKRLRSTQGFQNMDVKPNAKPSAFTTINSAYDGKMHLEGFSTTSDSAYLNDSNLFTLEQNIITKLKIFNEKYYGYQMCLRKNKYASGSCAITNGADIGLNDVQSSSTDVIAAVNAFNAVISTMNAKPTLAPGENTTGKKMTQQEFQSRHNQIKETANRISALRAELDMKMANMLDKTKGPLPEAQKKHNTENYVAIGWTILATSLVYYVFVEMK